MLLRERYKVQRWFEIRWQLSKAMHGSQCVECQPVQTTVSPLPPTSKTMNGALPPSSMLVRVTVSAHCRISALPAAKVLHVVHHLVHSLDVSGYTVRYSSG